MDAEVTGLRTRVANLEHWAHGLAKDKLNLERRMRNLTRSLGFESLREAEESFDLPADGGATSASTFGFSHKLPLSSKDIDACVKRIDELEKEGERARSEAARYAREVELVSAENRSLVRSVEEARSHASELEKANAARIQRFDERLALRDATIKALKSQLETRSLDSPPSPSRFQDISAVTDELKALREESDSLRVKHDTLLQDKLKLAAIYKQRVEEWKGFKQWLYTEALKKNASSSTSAVDSDRAHERGERVGTEKKLRGKNVMEIATSAADAQGRTALDMIEDLVDAAERGIDEVLNPNGTTPKPPAAADVHISLVTSKKRKRHEQTESLTDVEVPPFHSPAIPVMPFAAPDSRTPQIPIASPLTNMSRIRGVAALEADARQDATSMVDSPIILGSDMPNALRPLQLTTHLTFAAPEGVSTPKAPSRTPKAERGLASTTSVAKTRESPAVEPLNRVIDLTADSQGSETQAVPSEGSPTQRVFTSSPDRPRSPHWPPTSPDRGAGRPIANDGSSLIFLGENSKLEARPKGGTKSLNKSYPGQEAVALQPSNLPSTTNSRSTFSASQASTPKARVTLKPIPPPPLSLADIIRSQLVPENDGTRPSGAPTSRSASSASRISPRHSRLVMHTPKSCSRLPRGNCALGRTSLTDPRPSRTRRHAPLNFPTINSIVGKEGTQADQNIKDKERARVELGPSSDGKDLATDAEPDETVGPANKGNAKKQSKEPDSVRRVRKSTSSPAVFSSSPPSPICPAKGASASSTSRDVGRKGRPPPITKEERQQQNLKTKPTHEFQKSYALYKGRGRYAQSALDESDEGINSRYEIDRERNGGLQHPYDEVVRDKSNRKRMHAVDCPCCKEYYEMVGPLPPRLAPPLWKTPSPPPPPSKVVGRRHRSASPASPSRDQRQRGIQEHRQQASRHRHHWVPPNTPPDYWTIGFPDTQQVADINRRAKDMKTAKRKFVEDEASKEDGRYRRKIQ